MKRAATLLLLCALAAYGDDPRQRLTEGSDYYQKAQFDKAEKSFDSAAEAAAGAKLDPAVAKYNRANALMYMNHPDEASRYYQEALQTTDLGLQKRAYFNRGNALMATAAPAEQQGKLDDAKKAVEEALNMYVGAMTLDSADQDPKVNYELALQKKKQLEKKQQQQQQNQQNKNDKDKKDDKQDQKQDQDKKDQQKKQDQDKQNQQDKKDQKQDPQQDQQKKDADQQQQQAAKPEEMTKEEAVQLLDALKQQEQADREKIRVSTGQPVPVEKDW